MLGKGLVEPRQYSKKAEQSIDLDTSWLDWLNPDQEELASTEPNESSRFDHALRALAAVELWRAAVPPPAVWPNRDANHGGLSTIKLLCPALDLPPETLGPQQ